LSGFGHGGGALQRHLVGAPAGVHVIKLFFFVADAASKTLECFLNPSVSWRSTGISKNLSGANSLAYLASLSVMKKKFYNIVAWGQCFKLFIRNLRILVIS
jgi:hypothetical protein